MIFRTSAFRAEKTSVLHSGVYTREFTSMLAASALGVPAYMLVRYAGAESMPVRYIFVVTIFVAAFYFFRKYIFRETYLEVTFDQSDKSVHMVRHGITSGRVENIPFSDIRSVELGNKKFIPENIDGITFVQKISAQHGSAVPELSKVEEFITLSLVLTDGSERTMYAVKVDEEPEMPVQEIRSFIGKTAQPQV